MGSNPAVPDSFQYPLEGCSDVSDRGSKKAGTIVMIHGMCCGGWYWENFSKFFSNEGYHCLTPTLRFHDVDPGADPHPQIVTTSLLDYAADLENQIRDLKTAPILMGHSMGGLLAQILGSRGLAKALVLLAPIRRTLPCLTSLSNAVSVSSSGVSR